MTSQLGSYMAVWVEGLFKIVVFLPCWRASDGRPGRWRGGAGDGPTQGAHRQHALTARDLGGARTMLRELLNTWENWNTRTTLVDTLLRGHDDASRDVVDHAIDEVPEVHPLDALRANSELVRLLSGWQWQAVYDARWRGHTWPQIAQALGVSVERARDGYTEVIDRQERLLGRDVDLYRAVL